MIVCEKQKQEFPISLQKVTEVQPTSLNEIVNDLVEKARRHAPESHQRQRLLTQIIRLISGKLWWENTPYYQDALQQTWLYFCRNLCEATTAQAAYDSTKGSVVTWLNAYLKRRLQDAYINCSREAAIKVSTTTYQSASGEFGSTIDPVDNLVANPDFPPILEQVKYWVETDSTKELQSTHIKGNPKVNCQTLILKRLLLEVSWKDMSAEFGIPVSSLSSFYQRQCLPKMRKFAEKQGLL
ncbi:MAG: sigma-70 family RNA polymerase sigma factor [Cyanobacteria bacterium P01_A01_bin.80]